MNTISAGERNVANIVPVVRALVIGGTSALGTLTLSSSGSATETVVQDGNCALGHVPLLVPTSATAAGSGWWLKAVANGSFTIGHAASTAADRTFAYELRKP